MDSKPPNLKLAFQEITLHVDAPVGNKYFFGILKRICAFVIFESYFGIALSDLHFRATCAALYTHLINSKKIIYIKREDGSKRCIITEKVIIWNEFPTVNATLLPRSKENNHNINLIKKDKLRGSLNYQFSWSIKENMIYKSYELPTIPNSVILERQDLSRTKEVLNEIMKFRSEHHHFLLEEILRSIKLSSKSSIRSSQCLSSYNEWLAEPVVDINSTEDQERSILSHRLRKLYKGKDKTH